MAGNKNIILVACVTMVAWVEPAAARDHLPGFGNTFYSSHTSCIPSRRADEQINAGPATGSRQVTGIPQNDQNRPTLQSIEHENGTTIEKYSDGLVVQIQPNGNRSERLDSGYRFENVARNSYSANTASGDYSIRSLIMEGRWHGRYDSRLQSRLLQFTEIYLRINEPTKAEPLANEYFKIQQTIGAKGLPLALAQSIVGETDLKLDRYSDAIPLLRDAADYFTQDKDRFSYARILNNLGCALLDSGLPDQALIQFDLCEQVAKHQSFTLLQKAARENLRTARRAMSKQRKLSASV